MERAALIAQMEEDDLKTENLAESQKENNQIFERMKCPYLDTINRKVLDFDFEKLCSISLSHMNIYCCLVCGGYFQGRGKGPHAYVHALESGHHVFLNLHTAKFYCLPDNYEVVDPSLDDILYQLKPTFVQSDIDEIVKYEKSVERLPPRIATDGAKYWTG